MRCRDLLTAVGAMVALSACGVRADEIPVDGEEPVAGSEEALEEGCTGGEEVCDWVDNDCDGIVDEGDNPCGGACGLWMPPGETCYGYGWGYDCMVGIYTCSGLNEVVCGPDPDAVEVCDGWDNDCDMEIDEGDNNPCGGACELPGAPGEQCDGYDLDLCAEGTWSCAGLNDLACSDATQATPDACDGTDNDCDGRVDEGCGGGGLLLSAAGVGGSSYVDDIAVAADGSVYMVGTFTSATVFGAGGPNQTTLTPPNSWHQGYLAKYDPSGAFAWVRQMGGNGHDIARSVTVASDGTVLVAGWFGQYNNVAVFGAGQQNQTMLISNGSEDTFVARYDADGTFLSVFSVGGSSGDKPVGIKADAQGGFRLVGEYYGSVTLGAGQPGQATISTATRGIYIASFDLGGTLQWVRTATSSTNSMIYGSDVAIGPDGDAVVTSEVWCPSWDGCCTATFGDGPDAVTLDTCGSSFIVRYDDSGAVLWVTEEIGTATKAVAVSPVDGSVLVTGHFYKPVTLGAGTPAEISLPLPGTPRTNGFYVSRYDAGGTFAWGRAAGMQGGCGTYLNYGMDIAFAPDGSARVVGGFGSTLELWDEQPDAITIPGVGGGNVFISRVEAAGTLGWARAIHMGQAPCISGGDIGGIGFDPRDGTLIVAGNFPFSAAYPAVFGYEEAGQTALTSGGPTYLARYAP